MSKELAIDELLRDGSAGGLRVSIYLCREAEGGEERLEKVKLKGQLKTVGMQVGKKVSPKEKTRILSHFESYLSRSEWIPRNGSIGLFYSPNLKGHIRLPFKTQDLTVVSDSFHLKPVFKWLFAQKRFYLLSLQLNQSILYRGSCFGMEPILRDFSAARRTNRGSQRIVSTSDVNEKLQKQFINTVHGAALKYLHGETAPLLLVGNERMCSLFSEVCGYPFLLSGRIQAGLGVEREEELYAAASERVAQLNLVQEQQAIDDFLLAAAHQRAVTDLNDVAQALNVGRVRRLFVAEDIHLKGKILRDGQGLALVTRQTEGDDVLDDLAELAAAHQSQVLVLPRKRMPANVVAAATLRW